MRFLTKIWRKIEKKCKNSEFFLIIFRIFTKPNKKNMYCIFKNKKKSGTQAKRRKGGPGSRKSERSEILSRGTWGDSYSSFCRRWDPLFFSYFCYELYFFFLFGFYKIQINLELSVKIH